MGVCGDGGCGASGFHLFLCPLHSHPHAHLHDRPRDGVAAVGSPVQAFVAVLRKAGCHDRRLIGKLTAGMSGCCGTSGEAGGPGEVLILWVYVGWWRMIRKMNQQIVLIDGVMLLLLMLV